MLVPVQDKDQGATGPEHEPQTQYIIERPQYEMQWICDSVTNCPAVCKIHFPHLILLAGDIHRNNDILQHVHYPTQDQDVRGPQVFWNLPFHFLPYGSPRADGDGLEDTQEAGAANAHTPGHSVDIKDKFAACVIEKKLHPQSSHRLWYSFSEYNHEVSHSQVMNNQICGPGCIFHETMEIVIAEKKEVPQESNYGLM